MYTKKNDKNLRINFAHSKKYSKKNVKYSKNIYKCLLRL